MPFFHRHRLPQITVAEVDRYRAFKVREQGLSPESINKTITRLSLDPPFLLELSSRWSRERFWWSLLAGGAAEAACVDVP